MIYKALCATVLVSAAAHGQYGPRPNTIHVVIIGEPSLFGSDSSTLDSALTTGFRRAGWRRPPPPPATVSPLLRDPITWFVYARLKGNGDGRRLDLQIVSVETGEIMVRDSAILLAVGARDTVAALAERAGKQLPR